MQMTVNDRILSPLVVKIRQYSNTEVLRFVITENDIDLSKYYPYFVCGGESYYMKRKVSGDTVVVSLTVGEVLASQPGTNVYQIVFKDSDGQIWWYSSKGIFVVLESVFAEEYQEVTDDDVADDSGNADDSEETDSGGVFGVFINYLSGVPSLYSQ